MERSIIFTSNIFFLQQCCCCCCHSHYINATKHTKSIRSTCIDSGKENVHLGPVSQWMASSCVLLQAICQFMPQLYALQLLTAMKKFQLHIANLLLVCPKPTFIIPCFFWTFHSYNLDLMD